MLSSHTLRVVRIPLLRCSLPANSEEMGARAEQNRFSFDGTNQFQQTLAPPCVGPSRVKILRKPTRPLNGKDFDFSKTGF